jgi:resuscitation-promoting factor RpfB
VKKKSDELYTGETKVLEQGKVGIEARTYRETYLDGKLDARTLVSKEVAKDPVTEVLLVGTKKRPENAPTADGLNWAALASCESGGNPQAYNSAGPFYGLYQFMESTWHAVGGVGLPTEASSSEQTYRAQILYNRSGAGQWPVCGHYLFS